MYLLTHYWVEVAYAPNGAGPMTQPSMQTIRFQPQPNGNAPGLTLITGAGGGWPIGPGPVGIVVPGGDTPTIANFYTALTGSSGAPSGGGAASLAGDIGAQILAKLGQIQGFATGGG